MKECSSTYMNIVGCKQLIDNNEAFNVIKNYK
jgi:hypothetical protein